MTPNLSIGREEGRSWYGISSEVDIDPSTNDFISGVFRLIRKSREKIVSTTAKER